MPYGIQFIKYFFFFVIVISPIISWANAGRLKGEIEFIRVHEEGHSGGNWSPPVFWFSLKGVNNAGDCPVWSGSNTILFVAKGEMFYSMLLAAQAQGKKIAVAWDDAKTKNGFCRALFITNGDDPTLK